jgi:hypothetical protein
MVGDQARSEYEAPDCSLPAITAQDVPLLMNHKDMQKGDA